MMPFSVCMSVYKNDSPVFLEQAITSIIKQSESPDQVVLVVDGPIPSDLKEIIDRIAYNNPQIEPIFLPLNKGLGNALKVGVNHSRNEIIARMDSDDISLPGRFEKQLRFLMDHPNVDIVGGQMTEFIGEPTNIVGRREVPLTNEDIYDYMKRRCALNHVTVMFRKEAIIKAGNYQDWFWNEDYYLWVRMMMTDCVFANIPEVLVNVRSGADQYARRGGKKYFDSEIGIKKLMLENGMITRKEYLINYVERFIIQLLLPNKVRGWVFRTFARK